MSICPICVPIRRWDRLVNLSSPYNLFKGVGEGTGVVFYAIQKDLKESPIP